MPSQGRLGDKAQAPLDAHGCPACPHPVSGPAISGSPDVKVNGLPALRCDDKGIHAACCGPNTWTAHFGSDTVFINGRAAHRKDDLTRHCGGMGKLLEGSPNVVAGGNSVPCTCAPPIIPPDVPPDVPPDAPPDSPPDSPPDAPPDSPPDDPPDAPPDSPPDDPPDSPPDDPPDDPPDSPPDNPPDDPPPDAPPDDPPDDPPPDDPPPDDVKTGWLDVMVIDGGGTPVRGAQVRLEGATPASGQTDDVGLLRLPDLVPGRYQVQVGAEQASDASFPVEVTAGTPPPLPGMVPPTVASMPLPPEQELFARPSESTSDASPSARSSLVEAPSDAAPSGPSGGAPTGPASTGSQVGQNQAVAVMWKGWELILHEHPADLTDGAREGKGAGGAAAWKPDSVAASFNYQPSALPPLGDAVSVPYKMPVAVHPSRGPSGVSVLIGVTHPDVNNTFTVRREGPHKAPIIWAMDRSDPVRTDSPSPVERKLMGRARFSLYAGADVVTDANLKANVVDDLSLLVTVQNDESSMTPVFDIGILQSKGAAAAPKFFQGVIASAHKAGVQVLAGYGLVDRGEKRIRQFDVWLDQMSEKPEAEANGAIDAYAQSVISFLDSKVGSGSLRFDGLSFDIESCGLFGGPFAGKALGADKLGRLRRVLKRYYKTTAEILAVDNRICAITVGGMMSDDAAVVSGKLPSVPVASGSAMLAARLHVYDLAKEAPNIIIRPMAYDNAGGTHSSEPPAHQKAQGAAREKIPAFNNDPGQLEWHEAITKFALEEKQLHPAQFQLAMKHFTPQKTIELPDKTKETFSTGQGGNVPTSGRQDARATLMRRYRTGLILFAMGKEENWARNERLNGLLNAGFDGKPLPTGREGQPLQVPLDAAGAAALSKQGS